jgi:hypothetical protein
LFTGVKDEGLLKFMAEKTSALADTDPASKRAALSGKLKAIAEMRRIATARAGCLRSAIVEYFGEVVAPQRKSSAVRIVEWLFSQSVSLRRSRFCCDRCDRVGPDEVIDWAVKVFGLER